MRAVIFLFLFFFMLNKINANNYAFFAGEAENPGMDQFKNGFGMLSLISDSKNWDSAFLTRQTTDKSKAFTKENFEKQLDDLKKRILGAPGFKPIVTGDQLMLMIDTHGSPKLDNELTHSVSTLTEPTKLDGLQELIDLAEKKGIKLAIIDHSCYSGNILNLDFKSSCMMTSATHNNFGFSDYGTGFSFNLQYSIRKEKTKKVSIEDIFLQSRITKRDSAQPLINTEAGLKTFQFLKSLETYFKSYEKVPSSSSEMCQEHNITQKNQLDLLKISLKSQVTDAKVYKSVLEKFERLALVKTDFVNNVDYADKINAERTTICLYLAPESNKNGSNSFICKFPVSKPKKSEDSEDSILKRQFVFTSEDDTPTQFIERQCVSRLFEDEKSIEKGFISCITANMNYFDETKLQASIASPYSERAKQDDTNNFLALQNLPANEKKNLTVKKDTLNMSNAMAESFHGAIIQSLSNLEAEIYNDLYKYFSKKSQTKNSCSEFILN